MISTSTRFRSTRFSLALTLALLSSGIAGGCARLGVGARVHDLGDGRYRIVTSDASDVTASNTAAARSTCPNGYTVLEKGKSAETLYGSMVLGSDIATYWLIKCGTGK